MYSSAFGVHCLVLTQFLILLKPEFLLFTLVTFEMSMFRIQSVSSVEFSISSVRCCVLGAKSYMSSVDFLCRLFSVPC